MKQIQAGVLNVAYFDDGPTDGVPVFLLHGFPYDVHAYMKMLGTTLLKKRHPNL